MLLSVAEFWLSFIISVFITFFFRFCESDEELGELYGMLDTILNPLADMIPIPGCEFKIDMMEPSDGAAF